MECFIRDLEGSQVQVTVMASYGIISLSKKLTHICFSRLRSINEYLVINWCPKLAQAQSSLSSAQSPA